MYQLFSLRGHPRSQPSDVVRGMVIYIADLHDGLDHAHHASGVLVLLVLGKDVPGLPGSAAFL